jgi:hypothetical protein
MDVAVFHQAFLGRDSEHTPAVFRLTDRQRQLYDAFPTARGFSVAIDEEPSGELFLATLVLALAQTKPSKGRRVYLFTPRVNERWIISQTQGLVRYAARTRKGDTKALRWLREAFGQLTISWRFLQMEEPAHWTAFNLHHKAPYLPDWLRDSLIEANHG